MKRQLSAGGQPSPIIAVIGGGIAGMMSAFSVHKRLPHARVMVLEQGNYIPYSFGTSSRSAACSRQQFGCEHNVQMSLYSTKFYENFSNIVGEKDRMFWQQGYLFLYRDSGKWAAAQRRVIDQQSWGLSDVRCLSVTEVKQLFPYAYTESLLGATFCPTDGFLDPSIIISALRQNLQNDGVEITTGTEVLGFETSGDRVSKVKIDGGALPCDYVINCTGPWASRIGAMLGTTLPVAPEKRYLWSAEFRNPQDDFPAAQYQKLPFLVCNDALTPYIKPEVSPGRNSFLVGCEHQVQPSWGFQPYDQDWVDPNFRVGVPDGYHQRVWETLVDWLPFTERWGFRQKVNAGFYETTPTHSPVIGFDPNHINVIHCVGFSGHGVMHGPAAGATVADLIACGKYCQFPSGETNLSYESLVNETREVESMKI